MSIAQNAWLYSNFLQSLWIDHIWLTCCGSIEHLQLWISQSTFVDPLSQILMTARGKQVKLQTLQAEVRLTTSFYCLCAANLKFRMKSFSTIGGFSPLLLPKASVHCFPNPPFQAPTISGSHQIAYQTATASRHGKPYSKRDELGQFKPARVHISR